MKRILIADDSGTARMVIQRCLEIAGFQGAEFIEASNGKEALVLLKEKPADLVATDYNMPEMNGADLLKNIKASPRLHDIPVLVITSAANPQKIDELKKMEAFAVLSKPLTPAELAAALGPILDKMEDES